MELIENYTTNIFTSDSQSIIILPWTINTILPASHGKEYEAFLLRVKISSSISNLRIYNPKEHMTLKY